MHTKKSLVRKIKEAADAKGLTLTETDAMAIFETTAETIKSALDTDDVKLPGIGILSKNIIPDHKSLNPRTLEEVNVPARYNYKLRSHTQNIIS